MIRSQFCIIFLLISIASAAGMYATCSQGSTCFSQSLGFLTCPNLSPSRTMILKLEPSGPSSQYAIKTQWEVQIDPKDISDEALQAAVVRDENTVSVPPNSLCFGEIVLENPEDACPIRERRQEIRCRRPRGCSRREPCSLIMNPIDSPLCKEIPARCKKCCRGQPCVDIECRR